jgi:hypothetical protein
MYRRDLDGNWVSQGREVHKRNQLTCGMRQEHPERDASLRLAIDRLASIIVVPFQDLQGLQGELWHILRQRLGIINADFALLYELKTGNLSRQTREISRVSFMDVRFECNVPKLPALSSRTDEELNKGFVVNRSIRGKRNSLTRVFVDSSTFRLVLFNPSFLIFV